MHYSKLQFPLRVFPALGSIDEAWRGGGAARLYAGVRRPAHLPQPISRVQMTLDLLACADSSPDVPKIQKRTVLYISVLYCNLLSTVKAYNKYQPCHRVRLDKSSRKHNLFGYHT